MQEFKEMLCHLVGKYGSLYYRLTPDMAFEFCFFLNDEDEHDDPPWVFYTGSDADAALLEATLVFHDINIDIDESGSERTDNIADD